MRTRRLQADEHFVLVDQGNVALEFAFVELLAAEQAVATQFIARAPSPAGPPLTLVQGVSKGERMEQAIRQTTEIGVTRIIPLLSERVIVRLGQDDARKKRDRWHRIARSAAEQAGRNAVPQLTLPVDLEGSLAACADCDGIICAWEESSEASLHTAVEAIRSRSNKPLPHIALYIGPEGGFSGSEVERLRAAGALVVSLGPTILRTETAGLVASALLLHELGGLGNRA
jgi:16S rRNA (uracil1498-N3)-methyltransferase